MISNFGEIFKLTRLSLVWLSLIFIPVWLAAWAVGVLLPMLLENQGTVARAVSDVLKAITPLVAVMVFIPINACFMVLFERRALALFTMRKGPNRVFFDGYLQTAADAIKLLFKEDITPTGADAFMFTLAPIVFFAPSIFGALPLLCAVTNNHELFQIVNLPTGIFYILAASSVPVVALVMAGWASNNKYSLVGGLRSAAQAISYEIPLVLSLVTMCLLAGTLDVVQIANQQKGGILNWNIFGGGALSGVDKWLEAHWANLMVPNKEAAEVMAQSALRASYPVEIWSAIAVVVLIVSTFILAGLYMTGACAEINRIPFDLPEAESELVSGYNTEYSGIKFAIFFLAEFTNLFIVASIFTVMFLGGGDNPIPSWLYSGLPGWHELCAALSSLLSPVIDTAHFINPDTFWAAIWVIIKVYSLVFFAILVRGTLPRFRIDQLLDFGWKRLIPLSLIVFLIVTFARTLVHCHA